MKQKTYISIIIGLLIVVTAVWVGYSLYEAGNTMEVSSQATARSRKINDTFDLSLLENLEEEINKLPIGPEGYHLLQERVPQSQSDIVDALEE